MRRCAGRVGSGPLRFTELEKRHVHDRGSKALSRGLPFLSRFYMGNFYMGNFYMGKRQADKISRALRNRADFRGAEAERENPQSRQRRRVCLAAAAGGGESLTAAPSRRAFAPRRRRGKTHSVANADGSALPPQQAAGRASPQRRVGGRSLAQGAERNDPSVSAERSALSIARYARESRRRLARAEERGHRQGAASPFLRRDALRMSVGLFPLL